MVIYQNLSTRGQYVSVYNNTQTESLKQSHNIDDHTSCPPEGSTSLSL